MNAQDVTDEIIRLLQIAAAKEGSFIETFDRVDPTTIGITTERDGGEGGDEFFVEVQEP